MTNKKIMMKINEAIEAGKDKNGNVIKIPVFESIKVIDGELYGVIEGYADRPDNIHRDEPIKH